MYYCHTPGSVDSITRLVEERLGPGGRNIFDSSILVDFLSLVTLNNPAQENRSDGSYDQLLLLVAYKKPLQ